MMFRMERKGVKTLRGNRNKKQEGTALQLAPHPAPDRIVKELLALAKLEAYKSDAYYQTQIKPYIEYFTKASDKAEAFAFCRDRMYADMTTETPRLKEVGRELSERLRRFGGTGSKQATLARKP